MRPKTIAVIAVLLTCCFGSGRALAVTVTQSMVTKAVDTSACNVPTPATTFLTTDQSVWLWFNVTGANGGDVPSGTWYAPNGTVYQSNNWNPVASAGSWCFWASLSVAGNPPVSSPGNWSVRVSWNGSPLFTINFTISVPSDPSPADNDTALVPDESDSSPIGTRTPLILIHGVRGNRQPDGTDSIANLNSSYFSALLVPCPPDSVLLPKVRCLERITRERMAENFVRRSRY